MASPTPFKAAEIKAQLERILNFPVFTNSPILSAFLRFIVERSLAGETHVLKEYTIGVNILSKRDGYNPQTDATVRIHAGRLRRALATYYSGPGRNDTINISAPKGSYIPKFQLHVPTPQQEETSVQIMPRLAVLPFHTGEENTLMSLADGLCDQICTELGNFTELAVVSYYASRKALLQNDDLVKTALLLDAGYLLTGSIQAIDDTVRIRAQLIQAQNQQQLWTVSYEKERSALNTFQIQDDIVIHVVNQIAGSHGIIFRNVARVTPGKDLLDLKVYDAVFWYYHMVNYQNSTVFGKALSSMKEAIRLSPQYALGWAVLGETYVAGVFNDFDCETENPLHEAVRCGKEALKVDLRCHHAYQTLSLAYLFLHQKSECQKIIEQWLSLKSNAAGISGGLGFCLICAEEYDKGFAMLMDSIQLNPYYPWWFNGGLCFYYFVTGEWDEVIYWAEKMHLTSELWELTLKVAAYHEMGDTASARKFATEVQQKFPNVKDNPGNHINAFLQSEKLIGRLTFAVQNALKDVARVPS
ncbi:hypothetical protein WBG78_04335 [Chryseolinea sp. T2]|uniref:hypothetical protein n=1 Tax=Chryseolinea sp. T2 TaxID=3129255 RepID=UPI0030788805